MGDLSGFDSRRRHFISVCNQPPNANSAFHPFGVDKLSSEQLCRMCRSHHLANAHEVDSIAVRRVWQQFSRLNPSVHSAALRGGCWYCMIARFDCNCNKRRLLLLLLLICDHHTMARFGLSLINQSINRKELTLNRGQHCTPKYKYRVYKIANKTE